MKKLVLILIAILSIQGAFAQFTGGETASAAAAPDAPGVGTNVMFLKLGTSSTGGDLKDLGFASGYGLEFSMLPYWGKQDAKIKAGMIAADDLFFYSGDEYLNQTTNNNSNDLLMQLGIILGPTVSFFPQDKMRLCLSYGIHPIMTLGTVMGVDQTKVNLTMTQNIGFHFQYSKVMLGIDFDSGKMKINDAAENTIKIDAPTIRYTIGFRLK